MSILSKFTLTSTTENQPLTPLARKRIKLMRRLEQQILAAEAYSEGLEYTEEIKRWVRNDETNEREQITLNRPVKKWWWVNHHGALMITLKDGSKIIQLDEKNKSIEVGSIDQLAGTLEKIRAAVIAGELDHQLEKLIVKHKPTADKIK